VGSASPHLHERPAGMRATAAVTTLHAFSAFFMRLAMISLTVTAMVRMPAVVIGHHGHRDVAELGFTRQLGFGEVGHTDHIHAPASINVGLGLGGKRRPFHAEIRATRLGGHAGFVAGSRENANQLRADGIGELTWAPGPRRRKWKRGRACGRRTGREDEVERAVLFLERATALSEMMRSTPSDFMA